ncbi:MAG TPA: hypothetical protein VEA69_01545 [Tepidisphaeraceae bacterium]|nr:hypothetical protein [Tepidisphaeraceae bacterium]
MFETERVYDGDVLLAGYEDHREAVELGEWRVLAIGGVRLVRDADGRITVEVIEEAVGVA